MSCVNEKRRFFNLKYRQPQHDGFLVRLFDSFYLAVARLHLLSSSIQLLIQSQILAWHRILGVVIGMSLFFYFIFRHKNQVCGALCCVVWVINVCVSRIFVLLYIFFLFISISFYSIHEEHERRDTFIVYSFAVLFQYCRRCVFSLSLSLFDGQSI